MKLFEEILKTIIYEYAHEYTQLSFNHTNKAFAVGDTLFMKIKRAKYVSPDSELKPDYPQDPVTARKNENRIIAGKIIKIENGFLYVDTFTKPVKINDTNICATEAWNRAYEFITNGKRDKQIAPSLITFDYEEINGELYVIALVKPTKMNNQWKIGYKWDDLINGRTPKQVNFGKLDQEKQKTFFYLPKNGVVPFKIKDGAQAVENNYTKVPDEYIILTDYLSGKGNGKRFRGWNFKQAKNICHDMPWLLTQEALWCDGNKSKTFVLLDFINGRKKQAA